MKKKPSEEFIGAICDSGCLVQTCGICGKTIFCSLDEGVYEKEELEDYRARQKGMPGHYEERKDIDAVSCGLWNGVMVIPGCSDKCDEKLYNLEMSIVNNRFQILQFLKNRANNASEQVKMDCEALEGV
jgi:hypothetical protein